MPSSKIEFLFLKTSIEQFIKDLKKIDEVIHNKTFTEDEMLEIMSYLIVVKENIEGLEAKYSLKTI